MKAIIAVNRLGFIGLNGGLPWGKCKADLKHFKEMTMGQVVLIGHRTYETLPTLKGREIIVDDRRDDILFIYNRLKLFSDPAKYRINFKGIHIDLCPPTTNLWIAGGKATYEKYVPYLTELHISHIVDDTIGDTMIPDLSKLPTDCKIFHYFFHPSDDGKNFEN